MTLIYVVLWFIFLFIFPLVINILCSSVLFSFWHFFLFPQSFHSLHFHHHRITTCTYDPILTHNSRLVHVLGRKLWSKCASKLQIPDSLCTLHVSLQWCRWMAFVSVNLPSPVMSNQFLNTGQTVAHRPRTDPSPPHSLTSIDLIDQDFSMRERSRLVIQSGSQCDIELVQSLVRPPLVRSMWGPNPDTITSSVLESRLPSIWQTWAPLVLSPTLPPSTTVQTYRSTFRSIWSPS